jgi:predicted GNAT family acetyltransferase
LLLPRLAQPIVGRSKLGSLLARTALDDARARQLRVVPSCPFVRGYVERHQEYADLLARDAG